MEEKLEEKLEKVLELLEEINAVLHPDSEARLKHLLNIAVYGLEPMERSDIIEMLQLLGDELKATKDDPLRTLALLCYSAVVELELKAKAAKRVP